MTTITDIRRVSPGLVRAQSCDFARDYGTQLWSQVTSRQAGVCVISGRSFSGGEKVYRPVSSLSNRSWRVRAEVMDKRAEGKREKDRA